MNLSTRKKSIPYENPFATLQFVRGVKENAIVCWKKQAMVKILVKQVSWCMSMSESI